MEQKLKNRREGEVESKLDGYPSMKSEANSEEKNFND